jgi:hypothetical protein
MGVNLINRTWDLFFCFRFLNDVQESQKEILLLINKFLP